MHRFRGRSSRFLIVFVALAWLVLAAGAAHASCAVPPPIGRAVDEADIVFIGTVTQTTNDDRWATVEVQEVWKGEGIEAVVEVKSGPADPPGPVSPVSSTDRTFEEGVRYLFFPYRVDNELHDDDCTNTTRYRDGLDRFRPRAVHAPIDPIHDDVVEPNRSWVPYALAGAGAGFVVALIIVFARRRITD